MLTLDQIKTATTAALYHELAEAQSDFQAQELKVDRRRAIITGKAALELASDTPDTMAIIKTNLAIAEDEEFAAMQEELEKLGRYYRHVRAEIDARTK